MSKKKNRRARKATSTQARNPAAAPTSLPDREGADAEEVEEGLQLPIALLDDEDEEVFDYPIEDDVAALDRATAAVSGKRRRKRRKTEAGQMSAGEIAYLLAHPNKFVSEEELRAQYSFVLKDIRNMFALTAILIILLFLLAQFIQ